MGSTQHYKTYEELLQEAKELLSQLTDTEYRAFLSQCWREGTHLEQGVRPLLMAVSSAMQSGADMSEQVSIM